MLMQSHDREVLREQFINAEPFPFVKIDGFLDSAFANEVAAAYPSFEHAQTQGRTFKAVNEVKKVQVTDTKAFPGPVAQLNKLLASSEFLDDLAYITNIPKLVADDQLTGGGMHLTGPGGRLDVHVDFNMIPKRKLHRRLNLLLYLNPIWEESWGGHIQFWDRDVKSCSAAFVPMQNRCVIFETSDISFHGVLPVTTAAPYPRISFATYYYTREAPPNWNGNIHGTIFRARPEERVRRFMLMPAEKMRQRFATGVHRIKQEAKRLIPGKN
jgi:hypothetical protein